MTVRDLISALDDLHWGSGVPWDAEVSIYRPGGDKPSTLFDVAEVYEATRGEGKKVAEICITNPHTEDISAVEEE